MATFMERLAFLQKVPTLMKATADDETPCPGYLFEEIGKITHESVGCCQCLLEYLLERLQAESCHVKLKVIKILQHLCSHGSRHFLTELRRKATFIQEVTVFSGPPDPIHGSALHQRVRASAQELAGQLFTDTLLPEPILLSGMGSESGARCGMQGFGYSPEKKRSGGTFLGKIQKVAEVVASAVLPPSEQPGLCLHDNRYRAVVAPSPAVEVAVPACAYSLGSHGLTASAQRCPGLAGGGWEDSDSGRSSRDSSQESGGNGCRAAVCGSSRSGTDSHSGGSRESGDLLERVEAMQLGDCGREVKLVAGLTEGSKAFLSREESQRFLKECAILNCEVVVELLCSRLHDPAHTVQMRVLCAIACLMSSDLISLDYVFTVTHKPLAHLSQDSPGPVTNKATKLLRQVEALMGGSRKTSPSCANHIPALMKCDSGLDGPALLNEDIGQEDAPNGPCSPADSIKGSLLHQGHTEAIRTPDKPIRELTLFSGMELVSRGRTLNFTASVEEDSGLLVTEEGSKAVESQREPQMQHQPSAFSFLNV